MKKRFRMVALFMVLIVAFCTIDFGGIRINAAVDYVTAGRTTDVTTIYKDGEISVTVNVTGTPPVNVVKPNDVILLLDKSGSMRQDNRFTTMIESAKEFINLVDFSSHQVGIVDFSSEDIVYSKPLTSNSDDLKAYLDGVVCDGGTYTNVAISTAMDVVAQGRADAQPVIILLTDGQATEPQLALEAAKMAKEAGIVFYTIALLAPGEDPDASAPNALLKDMATTSHHHHFVLGSVGLIDVYRAIVQEIGISSAYEVNIKEALGPQFELVPDSYTTNIPSPTVVGDTLTWDMQELKKDTLSLTYKVRVKDGVSAGTYSLAPNTKITYKDYAGANRTYYVPNTMIEIKNYPPVITSITPDNGMITGGDVVTITGENFLVGANVRIGTSNAIDIQVVDSNTITATVPVGVPGIATVSVTNPDYQVATSEYRYWMDPVITSISPDNGELEGGSNVSIRGEYFFEGVSVYFGEKQAQLYKYYNTGYIMVKVPEASEAGAVDVKVVNLDGTSAVAQQAYTYNEKVIEKLEITSVSPNTGIVTGNNTVTVSGKKIATDAKIYFGDLEGIVKSTTEETMKTVVVPATTTPGIVDVTIVNPDGETVVLTGGYEYLPVPPPVIDSLSLAQGQLAGGEIIYITGKDFQSNLSVKIGGIDATLLNYYGPTKIRVTVPQGAAVGMVDVTVTNPDGQAATLVSGYEYLPVPEEADPTITKISPAEGQLVGGEIVYIDGTEFKAGLTVKIGDSQATLLNYYSATRIRVRVPAGSVEGFVNVMVTNPSGKEATLADGYNYLPLPEEQPPTINSISPAEGLVTGGEIVYINGSNFQSGLTVNIGGTQAELLNYYDATRIRIRIPAATVDGVVDVKVTNPSGKEAVLTSGYNYLPLPEEQEPTITSLSITEGELSGGEIVYIDGTNFKPNLTVKFGDNQARLLSYYSETRIRVQVPAGVSSGLVSVTITNPSGKEVTLSDAYRYKEYVPEITSISVTSGQVDQSIIAYIDGKNFASGLTVTVGGQPAQLLNYYSSTRLRVVIPASTTIGVVDVVVQNPDGGLAKLAGGYEYLPIPEKPASTVTSITTSALPTATPITNITVGVIYYLHGTDFIVSGTDKSIIRVVDSLGVSYDITPLNVYTTLKMRFRIPTTAAKGAAQLYIVTAGKESAAFPIIIQ